MADLAELFGESPSTIVEWAAAGLFPLSTDGDCEIADLEGLVLRSDAYDLRKVDQFFFLSVMELLRGRGGC